MCRHPRSQGPGAGTVRPGTPRRPAGLGALASGLRMRPGLPEVTVACPGLMSLPGSQRDTGATQPASAPPSNQLRIILSRMSEVRKVWPRDLYSKKYIYCL